MKTVFSALALTALVALIALADVSEAASPGKVTHGKTPSGIEYGFLGGAAEADQGPRPVLFVLAGTIDGTLGKAAYLQCGNVLAQHGYLCVSIDLPCHGSQTRADEPKGLSGWSFRAANNDDFVSECNQRLSHVLDHLIRIQAADPQKVAVCGTSRGGFLAIHFAAHDPRVKCAVGFAPVTDLAALGEFRAASQHPLVESLSLSQQVKRLAGRPVWMVIGDRDDRVGTQNAIQFVTQLNAEARQRDLPSQTELHIVSEPRGHTTPPTYRLGPPADWVHRQLTGKPLSNRTAPSVDNNRHREWLFVDDYHVLYRSGTERVFHSAKLNPTNPVIREDKPWEMAIGWTSVVRHPESGKYQLWYQAYAGGRDTRKSHKCVVCLAESDDGITFTKPNLGIHNFETDREPFRGRYTDTNIVLLGGGGYGDRYANSVLFEPHDSNRRYKMLYTDFGEEADGREWPGFFAAFSPDGIHWTKSTKNPLNHTAYGGRGLQPPLANEDVYHEAWDQRKNFLRKTWKLPLSMSDAVDAMYDPVRGKYVAYGKAWIQGPAGGLAWKHAMARVESTDFLTWSKPQIVASPDDLDPPSTEFHTSPVFFHKGVYFCLNQILRARGEATGAKADAMHIELMISRDGVRWERPFRKQHFIANSEQPFSNGGIFTNATPVILDETIRFYYGGYNSGAIGGGAKLTDPSQQSGIGFASVPLDRFAGIRPVAESAQSTLKRPLQHVGQVTLKPTSFDGADEITLNADAHTGSVRVEILNADGYRVPGFTRDDAIALTGDSLAHRIRWKDQTIADLPPGKYMIRLHLDHAEVFALTID